MYDKKGTRRMRLAMVQLCLLPEFFLPRVYFAWESGHFIPSVNSVYPTLVQSLLPSTTLFRIRTCQFSIFFGSEQVDYRRFERIILHGFENEAWSFFFSEKKLARRTLCESPIYTIPSVFVLVFLPKRLHPEVIPLFHLHTPTSVSERGLSFDRWKS